MPTYLSPGVYMEEVSSGSKPIEGVGTAVAAFVGFAEKGPLNEPTLVTNWTQFTQNFGDFVEGSLPGPRRVRLLPQRRRRGLRRAHRRRRRRRRRQLPTAPGRAARRRAAARPALAVKALEAGPAGDAITVEIAEPASPARRRQLQAGRQAQRTRRRDVRQRHAAQGRRTTSPPRVKAESKLIAVEEVRGGGHAGAGTRAPASTLSGGTPARADRRCAAADYVGDSADRTGFAGLEAIDDVTMLVRARPDGRATSSGMIDVEGVKAVQLAMIAHCELMADRVAILDPPPGLNAQQVKDWRDRRRRLRLEVRHAVLAVDQGHGPDAGQGDLRAAVRSHRRHLGPQRRHPRRAQGAGQRGRARRDLAGAATSPRASRTSSTRSGSTASARSPARASASGAPARCRATRSGATSTSAGCSTSSRSRSSTAPTGSCSSRTTRSCGTRCSARVTMFLRRVWRDGALFGRTPAEAFFVKCDEENNPPENRDAGHPDRRDRHRPGEAGRVRRLPHQPVLRRRRTRGVRTSPPWPTAAPRRSPPPRFSITIDGYEIASFSELQGITHRDQDDRVRRVRRQRAGPDEHPGQPGARRRSRSSGPRPPISRCGPGTRPLARRDGAARKSCSLVMYDDDGKPVARYHLENAWPSKIELGALRAGRREVLRRRSPSSATTSSESSVADVRR